MEEKTSKNVQFDLRRREFLKMGLAAGVLAGIPMAFIPKVGRSVAYAEITQALEKIPAETRWAIAAKALTGVGTGTQKMLFDTVGQDKYKEMMAQFWGEGGKASKQLADALGLVATDARSTAEAVQLVASVSMGPELKFETVKSTAKETVLRIIECPWWNRVKEFGISDDLLSVGSEAWTSNLAKSLNPKVTLTVAAAMCRGDRFCEYVYKLQK